LSAKAHIQPFGDGLFKIALPVSIPGYDDFIGAWLYTADPVVLVDVGVTSTSPHLLSALAELGISRLDLILLTHIHIDHAGGIGALARAFSGTPVVCHPKGLAHLSDPERLWQGSLKTLGKIAEVYGPITPVDPGQLIKPDEIGHDPILAIETPGHAAHHYSYLIGGSLFAGEACGVSLPLDSGVYLRPATPPRFFLETSLESLDKLIRLNPDHLCYSHVGRRSNAMEMMTAHREQLIRWRELIYPFFAEAGADPSVAMQACADHLLENDSLLHAMTGFPKDIQQRERTFLGNSIRGYWGYLQSKADNP
jgi:glyoxylase-like metal-dependent hydrolase (beta-lactamase superfamily II)